MDQVGGLIHLRRFKNELDRQAIDLKIDIVTAMLYVARALDKRGEKEDHNRNESLTPGTITLKKVAGPLVIES